MVVVCKSLHGSLHGPRGVCTLGAPPGGRFIGKTYDDSEIYHFDGDGLLLVVSLV